MFGMSANLRNEMEASLKRVVIPELRRAGFTGTLPHLRRVGQVVDLVTFQFDKHGGGFVIEVATGELAGFTTHWGKHIPANKLTAWDLHPDNRKRLTPVAGAGTDSWFRYDSSSTTDLVAANALDHLRQQYQLAEPDASPNGGPTPRVGDLGVGCGPPSVS
jgi:hypothetical protein